MYISIDGINYEIKIIKKSIKHTYLRVKEDLIIYVTTSKWTSINDIKKLINDEIPNLRKMINKQQRRLDNTPKILGNDIDVVIISNLKKPEYENGKLYIKDKSKLDSYYKTLAESIFKNRLDVIYSYFKENIPMPILKVRKMKSRWGVCNRKDNSITLNLELLKKEIKYLDYVIIHELSHFVHFNHSSLFWSLVSKYKPDYKLIRKELRE
ncbi:MAG: M48 family metallopeptidase [Bacilli bacterium]|nr:M48 family metallopeptidase [Bacilli bacterium]